MIEKKLGILFESDVIDKDTYTYVSNILKCLLKNKIITYSEQSDSFLTHLAMADMRRKKGEDINSLDESILEEIKNNIEYSHSIEIWESLNEVANKTFNPSELDYIYLHIINMLREE